MNRHWAFVWLLALAGCVTPQARSIAPEDVEREKDLDVRTVGDVTEITSANPWQVSGVGLVVGLEGTGGTPPGGWRGDLEKELRKRKVENIKALLDSPDNALVLVTGFIMPGARLGEMFDVEVTLPNGSKCTSLKGGYLKECFLRNHENIANINPDKGNGIVTGHILARAQGMLMVGLGTQEDHVEQRRAKVWQGGVSLINRPFYFALTKNEKSVRIASAVTDRINIMFQDDPKKQRLLNEHRQLLLYGEVQNQLNEKFQPSAMGGAMAKTVTPEVISASVPYAYRYNPERFLRVSRLIPLREDPKQLAKYRARLGRMLLDPVDTMRAALRLEALGKESVPLLKAGLESDHPFVRFAASEALAYLGQTSGIDALAELANRHPPLRAYALVAMASLDESICRSRLTDMLSVDDPQLRIGAFGALRLLLTDDLDSHVVSKNALHLQRLHAQRLRELGGEHVDSFWLHRVARNSSPVVQYSMTRRPEVVLFGNPVTLVAPVSILINKEYAITAEAYDQRLTISRVSDDGLQRKQCGLDLEDALRTLSSMGAQYPEIVEFLRNVEVDGVLNCPISMNRSPTLLSVEDLVELGRDDKLFPRDRPGEPR